MREACHFTAEKRQHRDVGAEPLPLTSCSHAPFPALQMLHPLVTTKMGRMRLKTQVRPGLAHSSGLGTCLPSRWGCSPPAKPPPSPGMGPPAHQEGERWRPRTKSPGSHQVWGPLGVRWP